MDRTDSFISSMAHEAIIEHIVENADASSVSSALGVSGRNERQDAIGRVVRDAVRKAPLVTISGEPHAYVPSQGIYVRFSFNDMGDALYDALRRLGVKDGDFLRIDQYVKLAMRVVGTKEARIDPSIVVMLNGVYDTSDHKLKKYDSGFISTSRVDYSYVPRHHSEQWSVFLSQVLPNRDHQKLLQEAIAMAYVDRTRVKLEYLTILKGSGANGKSVVFGTVMKLIGRDNVSTFSVGDLINSNRERNIAACNGKRMNYCSEIRTSEINTGNADAFKALVSGEPVMAKALYQNPFMAYNIPVLIANANSLPKITDPSLSIQRRILIIPFDVYIDAMEQDKEILRYIEDDISGVFNWVMEGLCRLQNNGYRLSVPKDIEDLVSEYISEYSSVSKWLRDRRIFARWNEACSPNNVDASLVSLYLDYKDWCYANCEDYVQRGAFARDLVGKGYTKRRKAEGVYFNFFIAMSEEEYRTKLVCEAVEMQKDKGVTDVEVTAHDDGRVRVRGVTDTERYLGLPPDSLLYYYRSGDLEGTYKISRNLPLFDVKMLQNRLAEIGYYRNVKENGRLIKRQTIVKGQTEARKFNMEMEMRGLPFFKYNGNSDMIPKKYFDKIRVPYDWEFTPEGAEELLREHFMKKYGVNDLNCLTNLKYETEEGQGRENEGRAEEEGAE